MNNVLGSISTNLIKLFDNIMEVEAYTIKNEYGNKISMTEVHTIAAIGMAELKSMSELAAQLNITVGTLRLGINNLVKNTSIFFLFLHYLVFFSNWLHNIKGIYSFFPL